MAEWSGLTRHLIRNCGLPMPAGQPTLPGWWQHLDRSKRLVLVTQGTIANRDFSQVVAPALVALGRREEMTNHRYHRQAASPVHLRSHPHQRPHRLIPALRADY